MVHLFFGHSGKLSNERTDSYADADIRGAGSVKKKGLMSSKVIDKSRPDWNFCKTSLSGSNDTSIHLCFPQTNVISSDLVSGTNIYAIN